METTRWTRRAWLRVGAGLAATLALAACGAAGGSTGATALTSAVTGAATIGQTTPSSAPIAASTDSTAVGTSGTVTSSTAAGGTLTGAAAGSLSAATETSASSSSAVSSQASSSAAVAAPPASAGLKLTLDAAGTEASYQVQEQLAGHDFPSQAIGRTSAVSGALVLDAGGKIIPVQSKLELDLRTLKSDQGMRDQYIQRDPLQTSQYPMATFVPAQTSGMPWPLPTSGTAKFDLTGSMTIHGTTKPMTWTVNATFAGDKVTGSASAPFTFTAFGMQPPHTMIALSVHDGGTLGLQFSATRATA